MAVDQSPIDHDVFYQYLNATLDAFKSGKMEQLETRSGLAHTITAAAEDNDALMPHVQAVLEREAV